VQAEVETAEYSPAKQDVQVEPPVLARVSVTLPAAQLAQAEVETAEYSPAEQAVQLIAPVLAKVLVMLPAAQAAQDVCPLLPWYSPAGQASQAVCELESSS
jgi:hypothetical protein